jgi:uncharacterized protein YukE
MSMARLKLDEDQLLKMKKNVDEANNNIAQLNGQLQTYLKQLKTEWGLDSVEELEEQISLFDRKINKLDARIQQETKELEQTIEVQENE